MNSHHVQKSFDCKHTKSVFDNDTGEEICRNCGQVLDQKTVDFSYEGFSENYQNMRTGPRITNRIHDGGLSTVMGRSNYDSSGNPVPYKARGSLNRMRIWDSRSKSRTTSNRNLIIALSEMDKLKEKMALSESIIEKSSYFYRKALEQKLIRGRTIKGMVGACVYAACRDLGTTRSIAEISKHLHERRHTIARSYRMLFQKLRLDVPITNPVNSIVKFSNNLNLPEKVKRDAVEIFESLKKEKVIAGKKPDAVAAASVYMACIQNNKDISQFKISEISGISTVTIRNRLNEFTKYVPLI
ncbi:transcription initiation factor IIB [Nitrosopumilus sp.]|uniref:transcription initiation factor IIB n=1 Tax=Nitrosopumilus sp. TaxID=2024843 RepID=UPI00262AAC21|nr:transcription initiation factor IIB [Nitrosopumilus sp.]